jgi:hypothetical protein
MLRTKFAEKLKTHVSYSVTFFFLENLAFFLDNVEKYFIAGQATYDNTVLISLRSFILRMRNVSGNSGRGYQNTFLSSETFFF